MGVRAPYEATMTDGGFPVPNDVAERALGDLQAVADGHGPRVMVECVVSGISLQHSADDDVMPRQITLSPVRVVEVVTGG